MKSEIRIENRAGRAVIDIEGVIGVPEEAQFAEPGLRVATWERFRAACERIRSLDAAEVAVNIRSGGGDMGDALLIYDALRSLPGRVVTRCCGYAASAATVIAQAASPGCRELAPGTLYLVHRSQSSAEGTADSMCAAREMLEKTDLRIARIYASHGGGTERRYRELMDANGGRGRWLTAEEAVAAGLADSVGGAAAGAVSGVAGNVPADVPDGGIVPADVPDGGVLPAGGIADAGEAAAVEESPQEADVRAESSQEAAAVEESPQEEAAGTESSAQGAGCLSRAAVRARAGKPCVEEAFMSSRPTLTEPVEDPPLGERRTSANETAYLSDLRRLLSLG